MSAVEFASLLRFELPASRHYQTVAGFLLSQFGRIPDVGDRIEVEGWRFEIVDLDGRRIDKVLAANISDASVQADT
jgi:putative hemolysin